MLSYSSTWTELVTPGESKLDYYQDQLHLKYQPVTVASQNISQWVPFYLYVPFCTSFCVCTILFAIISHELTAIHVQVFMCLLFANWHLSHALPSYPTVPLICPMSYVQCKTDLLSMRNNSRSIFSFGTTTLYFMMRTLYNVNNSQRYQVPIFKDTNMCNVFRLLLLVNLYVSELTLLYVGPVVC